MASKIKLMIEFVKVTNPEQHVRITEALALFNLISKEVEDGQMEKEQGIVMCRLLQKYVGSEEEE